MTEHTGDIAEEGLSAEEVKKGISVNRIIPNMVTVFALCAGLTAIRYAIDANWTGALLAIVAAAIFDTLDGRMARLLNGQSKFGAELDSLSDVVCFGVTPAIILYQWGLNQLGGYGWIACLALAACCALRLARFNTMLDEELPSYAKNYFTGVPAPAAAGLALLPVVFDLHYGYLLNLREYPEIIACWNIVVAFFMVSSIPTYSGKKMRIPRKFIVPLLALFALLVASLVTNTWQTILAIQFLYLISIPFASWSFFRLRSQEKMVAETE